MQYMYMYGQLCRKDTPVIASIHVMDLFIYLNANAASASRHSEAN